MVHSIFWFLKAFCVEGAGVTPIGVKAINEVGRREEDQRRLGWIEHYQEYGVVVTGTALASVASAAAPMGVVFVGMPRLYHPP